MSWRPELTVEDIVQHSKGRRDPEKNRQYFVEYRRKMKAAAKKPVRRTSRRRRSGSAAAARDAEVDDDEEEELAEGAGEEDGDEEDALGPGRAAEGDAAQLEAEGPASLDVEEPLRPSVGACEGAAAGLLHAMPPRQCKVRAAHGVSVGLSEAPQVLAVGSCDKCSSSGVGASSSSVPSSSEVDSILPNGPAAAVISAVAAAAAAAAAAATSVDVADAAGAGTGLGAQQLEPRSAQLSCHPSPLRGSDGADVQAAAGALPLPAHCPALAPSRAASSALPAAQLPQLAMPCAAVGADFRVLTGGLVLAGAHVPAGVVTQIAVRRTRGPSTSALLRRGSTTALCGGESAAGCGGGGGSGCLSHQGSISATTSGAAAAVASGAVTPCGVQLPQEPLLGMLGAADFSGAWGCGGLGPGASWTAEWESQSSWPAEADAVPASLESCEAAAAPGGVSVSAGGDLGCSGVSGGGANIADGGCAGSGVRPLEPAGLASAPILPPLSPAAACAAAVAAAAVAAKPPIGLVSASSLGAAPPVCGAKRPLDLAYAASATSLMALVEEPLAKQHRRELMELQLQRQPSEVVASPDVCGARRNGAATATTSNGSSAPHGRASLNELQLPHLSPAPCEPAAAPVPAPPAGLPAAPGCNGAILGGPTPSAYDSAAYGGPLPPSGASGTQLQRGVSPTLPAAPAPCLPPGVFTMINSTSHMDSGPAMPMPMRTDAAVALKEMEQLAASLWQREQSEDRELCSGGGGGGGAPSPFAFASAPAGAAEAPARAADEEVGAETQGWLDSLLVDPEAFDHMLASASPRGAAGPPQHACLGCPLSCRQPLEQQQQQPLQQQQMEQQRQGLRSGGLLSVSSHGGCGNSMGVFILV
ncbi:hypothetical protein HYH02_000027 [Chlamydomonas schloesseri]|uniref:Uncharacterized protein n=1 Tax=Chlamydomonas schloesseri TaxID=2026947 RepID=A0A835WLP9_9CHLO|nr:hypothetical protein HYH02_000027 [Chlamydomonas schloesseri]|eukprot:KAG2449922.1 hypothetical protein HYH02_000027 [Chlamydomonas schloesseri]